MRPNPRAAVAALALLLAACSATPANESSSDASGPTGSSGSSSSPSSSEAQVATATAPGETAVVATDAPADLAAGASAAFFKAAPVVVLGAGTEALRAASAGLALGVPVLLDGPAAAPELERLGTATVVTVGDVTVPDGVDVVPAPADDAALADLVGATGAQAVPAGQELAAVTGLDPAKPALLVPETHAATSAPAEGPSAAASEPPSEGSTETEDKADGDDAAVELPAVKRAKAAAGDVVVMTTGAPEQAAAVANARTAGARVQTVPGGDPRATSATVQETAANAPGVVVGLGTAFGDPQTLTWRTAAAATGTELPGGGQLVLPGKTYVALYGNPTTGALGVLGEQGPEATVERAQDHAEPYQALTDTTVVPALEIISTVASAGAGDDGNYTSERPIEELRPLVDLAHEKGLYVVLDLQPGRTDFVTQAKMYEELLKLPNVGLALDPEWRLRQDQVHLVEIGQVDVAEVNQVVTYLADLTRANNLPQKLLVLHQFQVRMIPGVNEVDQSRSELAVLIHADGQGGQGAKQGTWSTLRGNAPAVTWWGWKNFYDEDQPMLTPEQTMQVQPTPNFISYQ